MLNTYMRRGMLLMLFALTPLLPSPAALARSACILDPGRVYMEGGTEEAWRVEHWRNQLRARGYRTDVITGSTLERGIPDCEILILPGVSNLTSGQTQNVLDFLISGKNLILTSRAGEKRAGQSEGSLAGELGLRYTVLDYQGETAPQIIMNTPSYLTCGLMPGQLFFTGESDEYISLRAPEAEITGYWFISGGDRGFDYWFNFPAAAASTRGEGRFFWMSPTIELFGGDMGTANTLAILIDNILNWFENVPVVEKNPWKKFYPYAITFAQDTESGFGNTLDLLKIKDLPDTTFFILTDMAEINMSVFNRIAQDPRAELAVHGDSHDVFRGQSLSSQTRRFENILAFKEKSGQAAVAGFRPPEEAYDYYTLKAMVETGFEYIFADDWPTSTAPKILYIGGKPLVQFPMLNKDDIKIISEQRLEDNELILAEYIEDIDYIFSLGGLYMFDFHSHVLVSPKHIPVLRSLLDYLKPLGAWMLSCRQMSDWWKTRDNVQFTLARRAPGFIEIEAVNRSENNPAEGVSFSVWFPGTVRSARAEPDIGARTPADFRFRQSRAVTVLPELQPLETYRFRVIWEN